MLVLFISVNLCVWNNTVSFKVLYNFNVSNGWQEENNVKVFASTVVVFLFFLIYLYTETGVRTFVSYFDSCISHYQLLQVSCLLKLKALTNPFVLILFNTIFIIVFMAQYFSCMCRGEGGRGGIFAWKWIGILYIFFMETFQATKLASSKQWQGIGFSYWILTSCQPHKVTTQWNQFQKRASG